ncbi:TPA: peptidoglycan DD-metalloendopeptidase family protein [Stenotrophomonas maltophilia]|nr:peptidoglycan DD-metalloendopeptidase family protein [Stenotrophomonas maltophilia]HDS1042357.1 peptidoglycan DD-metalloendopeptidase family protein [Stenotrophomonas maltophilia]
MADIYTDMVQPTGAAYKSSQIKSWSHYREPIDHSDGRLHGDSRRWGDASDEVQSRVIDTIIESARDKGLSPRETAHVLAIARVESGFNPDAAAGTTSASGLGQFIDKTGAHYDLNGRNRFDVGAQADALVDHYIDNRTLAHKRGQGEDYIYKYHHDGPSRDYGGLGLSEKKVMPYVDKYEQFVEQRLAQTQGHTQGGHAAAPAAPAAAAAAKPHAEGQTRSFDQTMQVMLPQQNGVKPHVTGEFGEHRAHKPHGGTDFNYVGGQAGRNLQHPTVNAPISGTVTFVGGDYGTVKIRDAQGNSHEILHLQSTQVKQGDPITAGEPIGTMGGRGPKGANQYAQHVHYQLKDPAGKLVSPQEYWDHGKLKETGQPGHDHDHDHGGVLRKGSKGEEVTALQKELNRLGVRDSHGNRLSEDGNFGANTHDALSAYQKQNGLKADGVAGPATLGKLGEGRSHAEAAPKGPLLGEKGHPDTPLHDAIRGHLPTPFSNEMAANITAQAKAAGIDAPEKLQGVNVQADKVFVMGNTPGFRAAVDLSQPAPSVQETSAALLAKHDPSQQHVQEEQQRVALGR